MRKPICLFVCAMMFPVVLAARVNCTTTVTTFEPLGGCNTDVNGDQLLEKHAACTCTKSITTCDNGREWGSVSCDAKSVAPPTGGTTSYGAGFETTAYNAYREGVQSPAPQRTAPAPQPNARFEGRGIQPDARSVDPRLAGQVRSSLAARYAQPLRTSRILRCRDGFADIVDAAGKPLEPVGPCNGEWTAEIDGGTDLNLP